MPSTVTGLLQAAGLEPVGCVPWGERVPEAASGVYLVSLTGSPSEMRGTSPSAPVSLPALDALIATCPGMTLDGNARPSAASVAARISSYWLADECILYIGLATSLRSRVSQYYKTPLGAAKPHKGGWWLKTLSVLDTLHVHYAVVGSSREAEETMLRAFAAQTSPASRALLPTADPVMPFANLRDGDWRRRRHGISGATAGTMSGRSTPPLPRAAPQRSSSPKVPATKRTSTPGAPLHPTQKISEKDIAAGQIRVPRATKDVLPADRASIEVRLLDRTLVDCRWDPRLGPPERSGVIRVGKAAAQELLTPGEVLVVSTAPDGLISIG